MNKKRLLVMPVMVAVLALSSPALWACRAAGPNKHVGHITAVDDKAGTVTLLDAETNQPIVFVASPDIVKEVRSVRGQVMISYAEQDGKLIARDVHY